MIDDAYADQCLRKFILEYLGKMLLKKNCRNCSNCLDKNDTRMFKALLSHYVGKDEIRLVVTK